MKLANKCSDRTRGHIRILISRLQVRVHKIHAIRVSPDTVETSSGLHPIPHYASDFGVCSCYIGIRDRCCDLS
jgi:hypothetical protein